MPSLAADASTRRKIKPLTVLARLLRRAQAARQRVVFTNGCFDLLHAGHIQLLERAKVAGDILVVAINSDRSVRALKGRHRPLVSQADRARLLAALACVDYVTVFNELTPLRAIERLRPDVLIKGADWGANRIIGRGIVERHGGTVLRLPLRRGYSTSALIERIRTRA